MLKRLNFSALFLCLGSAFMLSSCGGHGNFMTALKMAVKMEPTKVWLQKVFFEVDEKLNKDSPVTVHIVIAYDTNILQTLSTLTSDQYFKKLDQLKRDAGEMIDIFAWDIVPGQTLAPQPIKPTHPNGLGCLIFARYSTPGDHRQAVGPDREITLEMGTQDFRIVPLKNEASPEEGAPNFKASSLKKIIPSPPKDFKLPQLSKALQVQEK